MPQPIRIIEFSDYLCPWCYPVAVRLQKLQAQFQEKISVQVHPFALRREKSVAPFEFQGSYVERGWKSAALMTRTDGISYQMWDQRPLPRWSLPGLYAGTAAQRQGSQLFERFHLDMFAAYFGRSEDITSKEVVVEVARRGGLDVDRFSRDVDDETLQSEVFKKVVDAMSIYPVSAVPTVIIGGGISLQGAVPADDYLRALAKAGLDIDEAALNADSANMISSGWVGLDKVGE